jgi:hypothetical protein
MAWEGVREVIPNKSMVGEMRRKNQSGFCVDGWRWETARKRIERSGPESS